MANRRKSSKNIRAVPRSDGAAPASGVQARHEAIAVVLGCTGLLTLLALWSYDAADASLNASGTLRVRNWIGPAGAYWADLLLQVLGIGSYALALGVLLAAWRALWRRKILPGLREAAGTLLLVVCSGAFAHLVLQSAERSYPAGGIAGALLAELLLEQFAVVGAYILSGALVLLALALTADGILHGLGLRGLVVLGEVASRVYGAYVVLRERRRRFIERRAELAATQADVEPASESWTLGEALEQRREQRRQRREERLKKARSVGRALGERMAEREVEQQKKAKAVHDASEPEIELDKVVDLPVEESFAMGDLPAVLQLPQHQAPPMPEALYEVELEPEDVDIDVPIRAVTVDPAARLAAALPGEEVASAQEEPGALAAAAAPETLSSAAEIVLESAPPKRSRKTKSSEPNIVDVRPEVDTEAMARAEAEPAAPSRDFQLPPVSLLDFEASERAPVDSEKLRENAGKLTKTLKNYGVEGQVREIRTGPVVTMYEFVPGPGTKVSKIAGLADDLAMSMEALRVRIVAPIPGKGAVGIEIPNDTREMVYLKEILSHDSFRKSHSQLTLALGKDIEGKTYSYDLAKMPHLLVAGATGAGKSVSINAMIMSILYKATPEDVRMIMVDPKMLELSIYEGIPHLLLPVVTDPKKASLALRWAVEEMERRYHALSALGVRNIVGYNKKIEMAKERGQTLGIPPRTTRDEPRAAEKLPYIVIIVDELADLMMVASREVEASIMRLAQMARAAGIHLVLATQRPSVDVITGVIKANFPTRVAFQVASKHDSRTILDANGAEHLLGQGDMLFMAPGAGGIRRVHGAYVSEEEIERTVNFLREQGTPEYDESILAPREDAAAGEQEEEPHDEMYDQAVAIVSETRQASISMIQRRLRIGYNRAARMVERMEADGIVGPADGAKPREVLIAPAA